MAIALQTLANVISVADIHNNHISGPEKTSSAATLSWQPCRCCYSQFIHTWPNMAGR